MWDKAMENTDGELLGSLFAEHGELMLENMESIVGRDAITDVFAAGFETNNFTGWSADYTVFDVHEESAYVIGDFDIDVYPYDGRPPIQTVGRAVWFWKRQPDGVWKIAHAISARRGKSVPITT